MTRPISVGFHQGPFSPVERVASRAESTTAEPVAGVAPDVELVYGAAPAPEPGVKSLGEGIRALTLSAWLNARDRAIAKVLDEARPSVRREVAAVGSLAARADWPAEKVDEVVEARTASRCAKAIAAVRAQWDANKSKVIAAALHQLAWQTLDQLQATPVGDDGTLRVAADLRLGVPAGSSPEPGGLK